MLDKKTALGINAFFGGGKLDSNKILDNLDLLTILDTLLSNVLNKNNIVLNKKLISNLLEISACKDVKSAADKKTFVSFNAIRLISIGLSSKLLGKYIGSLPKLKLREFTQTNNLSTILNLVIEDLNNKSGADNNIIKHSGNNSLLENLASTIKNSQSQENYNRDIYQDVTDAAKKIDVIVTEFYANIANPNGYKSYLPPSDWKSLSFEDLNDLADVVQWNCHDYWLSKKKQVTKDLIDKANKLKIKVISDTVKWREKKNNYNENSCWFNNKS